MALSDPAGETQEAGGVDRPTTSPTVWNKPQRSLLLDRTRDSQGTSTQKYNAVLDYTRCRRGTKIARLGAQLKQDFLGILNAVGSRCIMKPPSVSLTVSASHPVWVYTPAVRVAVDRFGFSALASVRPTIVLPRTVRCLRKFVRPLPPFPHWLHSVRRPGPKHPSDTPCRTAHGNESWALPITATDYSNRSC